MKTAVLILTPVLVVLLGVPLFMVTTLTVVAVPAIAEQIRIDPCSAFPDQANVTVAGAEEGGIGFELPKPGTPRHQSLTSPAQTIPARIKVNRPGVSGDSKPWEGWSHVRKNEQEVSG